MILEDVQHYLCFNQQLVHCHAHFNEFHPATFKQLNVAECLLVISVFTGVTPIMINNILLFGFEGYISVTWNDMTLTWSSLVTLNFSILTFLEGLLLWSVDKSNYWTIPVLDSIASILLLINCRATINTCFVINCTTSWKRQSSRKWGLFELCICSRLLN